MQTKFTMKDKKEDILSAFEELLTKYKEKEKLLQITGKEVEVKKTSEEAIIKKTSAYTVESIIKGIADLKLDLSKTLTDLSDKLLQESNKLQEIQDAISVQTKNLEEIYDVKITAGTLDILIKTYEEKKKIFEEEITFKKSAWQKEQEEYEKSNKERDANLKKERDRETEEYNYKLTAVRKKDKDTYEEEKVFLKKDLKQEKERQEKELAEREAHMLAQEKEFTELKDKSVNFPVELEKAIEKSRIEAVALTEMRAKQKADLLAKEVEGDKRVYELRIKTLEDIAVNQNMQIDSLAKQLNSATTQVQNIAVKAIEGASGIKALSAVNEIALEQAKNTGIKK